MSEEKKTKIDFAFPTIGRTESFQRAMTVLNDCHGSDEFMVWIMDGNPLEDTSVIDFMSSKTWNFPFKIFRERLCIPEENWGKWAVFMNFLFKQGTAPWLTWHSDDIFPQPFAYKNALIFAEAEKNKKGVKPLGAISFVWSDGFNPPYMQYGTAIYARLMVNFGIISRKAMERVEFLDEKFQFYNGDQDLSLKLHFYGFDVVSREDCQINHAGAKSQNKYRDEKHVAQDNEYFKSKWSYDNGAGDRILKLVKEGK